MRIVVTGMVGLDKKSYLEEVCRFAHEHGREIVLCNVGDMMYAEAPDIPPGKILDISLKRLASLRRSIGIVQQDVYLYAGTVRENIRYGKPEATDEEIIQAARSANAHEFIAALPQGYDTDVGQRGVKLSGGQRQRQAIARVFLENPPILLFDEATSALDSESERAVQESLEKLAQGRTTLVIAHRLSTVRKASRILVLTEQGIIEQGGHRELLESGGAYARIYNMQLQI
jgi:ATP-binding cassette subfamily B protein